MPYVTIRWSDDQPHVTAHTDAHASVLEGSGVRVALVEDQVLEAWQRHAGQHAAWCTLWRSVDELARLDRRKREDEQIGQRCRDGLASLADAQVALGLRDPQGEDSVAQARSRCLGRP